MCVCAWERRDGGRGVKKKPRRVMAKRGAGKCRVSHQENVALAKDNALDTLVFWKGKFKGSRSGPRSFDVCITHGAQPCTAFATHSF